MPDRHEHRQRCACQQQPLADGFDGIAGTQRGAMRARTRKMPSTASTSTSAPMPHDSSCLRRRYSAAANRDDSDADSAGTAPGDQIVHVVHEQAELRATCRHLPGRHGLPHQRSQQRVLRPRPDADHDKARQQAPQCREQAVVTRQRMQLAHATVAAHQRQRARLAKHVACHRKGGNHQQECSVGHARPEYSQLRLRSGDRRTGPEVAALFALLRCGQNLKFRSSCRRL